MMRQLDYFKKFISPTEQMINSNFEVWSYTRVSSKEQFEQNSSVERQKDANRAYAATNSFTIIEEFGGTYESAKSDFTTIVIVLWWGIKTIKRTCIIIVVLNVMVLAFAQKLLPHQERKAPSSYF